MNICMVRSERHEMRVRRALFEEALMYWLKIGKMGSEAPKVEALSG